MSARASLLHADYNTGDKSCVKSLTLMNALDMVRKWFSQQSADYLGPVPVYANLDVIARPHDDLDVREVK